MTELSILTEHFTYRSWRSVRYRSRITLVTTTPKARKESQYISRMTKLTTVRRQQQNDKCLVTELGWIGREIFGSQLGHTDCAAQGLLLRGPRVITGDTDHD